MQTQVFEFVFPRKYYFITWQDFFTLLTDVGTHIYFKGRIDSIQTIVYKQPKTHKDLTDGDWWLATMAVEKFNDTEGFVITPVKEPNARNIAGNN